MTPEEKRRSLDSYRPEHILQVLYDRNDRNKALIGNPSFVVAALDEGRALLVDIYKIRELVNKFLHELLRSDYHEKLWLHTPLAALDEQSPHEYMTPAKSAGLNETALKVRATLVLRCLFDEADTRRKTVEEHRASRAAERQDAYKERLRQRELAITNMSPEDRVAAEAEDAAARAARAALRAKTDAETKAAQTAARLKRLAEKHARQAAEEATLTPEQRNARIIAKFNALSDKRSARQKALDALPIEKLSELEQRKRKLLEERRERRLQQQMEYESVVGAEGGCQGAWIILQDIAEKNRDLVYNPAAFLLKLRNGEVLLDWRQRKRLINRILFRAFDGDQEAADQFLTRDHPELDGGMMLPFSATDLAFNDAARERAMVEAGIMLQLACRQADIQHDSWNGENLPEYKFPEYDSVEWDRRVEAGAEQEEPPI